MFESILIVKDVKHAPIDNNMFIVVPIVCLSV